MFFYSIIEISDGVDDELLFTRKTGGIFVYVYKALCVFNGLLLKINLWWALYEGHCFKREALTLLKPLQVVVAMVNNCLGFFLLFAIVLSLNTLIMPTLAYGGLCLLECSIIVSESNNNFFPRMQMIYNSWAKVFCVFLRHFARLKQSRVVPFTSAKQKRIRSSTFECRDRKIFGTTSFKWARQDGHSFVEHNDFAAKAPSLSAPMKFFYYEKSERLARAQGQKVKLNFDWKMACLFSFNLISKTVLNFIIQAHEKLKDFVYDF